jgi:demethylmenaquinone methyltransferase/2-methoxy-6-polyprenyl-1,4-benzoquinol methylase
MNSSKQTHFGYRDVDENDKAGLVGEVFNSVAGKYDLMNDLMSMGNHRLWKAFTVRQSSLKPGAQALDIAAGTGDLSRKFADQVGPNGKVVMTDINSSMLEQGKIRMIDAGYLGNIEFGIEDAENLSFEDNRFDCVSISFGLRNVTRIPKALKSMYRVTKPGGRLLVLEFSHATNPILKKLYDAYSFNVIPKIGEIVAHDKESYQYLVESIRKHPDQETLKSMMLDAGFDEVRVHNMHGGIVALHIAYKY